MQGVFIVATEINARDFLELIVTQFFVPPCVGTNLKQRYLASSHRYDPANVANIRVKFFSMDRHQWKGAIR